MTKSYFSLKIANFLWILLFAMSANSQNVQEMGDPLHELLHLSNKLDDQEVRSFKGKAPSAFFCRLEHKNLGKVKMNTRFRLGSYDETKRLEKNESYDFYQKRPKTIREEMLLLLDD